MNQIYCLKCRRFLIVNSSLVGQARKMCGSSFEVIDELDINFDFERKMFNPRSAFKHIQTKNKKRGVA